MAKHRKGKNITISEKEFIADVELYKDGKYLIGQSEENKIEHLTATIYFDNVQLVYTDCGTKKYNYWTKRLDFWYNHKCCMSVRHIKRIQYNHENEIGVISYSIFTGEQEENEYKFLLVRPKIQKQRKEAKTINTEETESTDKKE